MISWYDFQDLDIAEKVSVLYKEGDFVTAIRYYGYKVNLYLLNDYYVEVFYNHKEDCIERIDLLEYGHSRMKFYVDQIHLSI